MIRITVDTLTLEYEKNIKNYNLLIISQVLVGHKLEWNLKTF